jgi:4-O-beta-D-mannosyl-D-glucose phosphorylase
LHVAHSTIAQLLDYCFETGEDGLRSAESIKKINTLIDKNIAYENRANRDGC